MTGTDLAIAVHGVRKRYGEAVAVGGVDLAVRRGETLALLGPSGCGKTTLLRMIAGLERPDEGTIEIGGRVVDGPGVRVPPERRRVGMVFQDVALFPHLSVAENVAFGIARRPRPGRETRVHELLDLVGLADGARLRPHELSGGMQQRVALARALAPEPEVVLLDEPFANLDLALRTQLRHEVRRILDATSATAVFVTHDQADALTIADRVAVMRRGLIDQEATPELVYTAPATPFVASFVGVANLVHGAVASGRATTELGAIDVGEETGDGRALVLVRPEHCDLLPLDDDSNGATGPARPAGAAGRVIARRFAGSELLYEVVLDDTGSRLWVEAGPLARRLAIGDPVRVVLRVSETVAFPVPAPGAS